MLPPVDSQHDDVVTSDAEVDGVRKPCEHCTASFIVRALKGQRIRCDARHEVRRRPHRTRRRGQPGATQPLPNLEDFVCGLRPEDDLERHAQPSSFGRTSDQGTADRGFSTCSAHRRSSSARCASVSSSSPVRSTSVRLSHRAMACSARSRAGSLRSCGRGLDGMARSSHVWRSSSRVTGWSRRPPAGRVESSRSASPRARRWRRVPPPTAGRPPRSRRRPGRHWCAACGRRSCGSP